MKTIILTTVALLTCFTWTITAQNLKSFEVDEINKCPCNYLEFKETYTKNYTTHKQYFGRKGSRGNLKDTFVCYQRNATNTDWTFYGRGKITYDTSGRIIEQLLYYEYGLGWTSSTKATLKYDSFGNKIEVIKYELAGIDWLYIDKFEYTYDSNNNIIEEIYFEWDYDHWEIKWKYIRLPDSSGLTMEGYNLLWKNSKWDTSQKAIYNFDTTGNFVEKLTFFWDTDKWKINRIDSLFYTNNYLTSHLIYFWKDNLWIAEVKTLYKHNENGFLTERIYVFFER